MDATGWKVPAMIGELRNNNPDMSISVQLLEVTSPKEEVANRETLASQLAVVGYSGHSDYYKNHSHSPSYTPNISPSSCSTCIFIVSCKVHGDGSIHYSDSISIVHVY